MARELGRTAGFVRAEPVSGQGQLSAGPFDVLPVRQDDDAITSGNAFVIGLLVIYPVLAIVAVIAVSLFLSGPMA